MDTSTPRTPQPGPSGRGALPALGFEMTPLRKNRPSVMFQLDASNDDIERAERRKSVALRKSVLSLPPSSGKTPDLNESARPLTEDDIRTHLQICTKLHNENKINMKNAWSLKIIDVLRYMVKKDSPDVLKVAGNSLEIAGKVYGLRVDDLHAEGMKLAGSLARNFDKRGREDDEENDENADPNDGSRGDPNGAGPKKKKAKKRRPLLGNKKHTVNPDPKSWRGTLPKMESATFSARTDTTVSAVGNLFTNRVRMDPAGYKFRFLDKEKAWSYEPGNDPSVNKETNRKFPLKLKPLGSCQICAPFKDFHLDKWNPDDESKEFSIRQNSQRLDEVVLDDDGIPIPELDGSIHDFCFDRNDDCNDDGDPMEEELAAVPHVHQELQHIVDFQPTEQTIAASESRSVYSYNTLVQTSQGQIDRIWAGPSHWKLKFIRSAPPVYTGRDSNKEQEKKKKAPKKKKNEPRIIMMADLKPPIDSKDFDKKKKPKKKSHVVDNAKITLPLLDSSCKRLIEDKEKLMTIPSMKPVAKTHRDEDLDVSAYNYDNPNDSRYVPQDGADEPDLGDDIFDNADNDLPMSSPAEDGADAAHAGLDLIEAPQMVPQTHINYATRAKKMDMKKLKQAVWTTLTHASENDLSAQVTPTSFSNMYKALPQNLTERMKQELSCPMAFVALLHLCNEQNLELKKGPDLTDFGIAGPSGGGVSIN